MSPATEQSFVCGGGWNSSVPYWVRASVRNRSAQTSWYNDQGFRCVLLGRMAQ